MKATIIREKNVNPISIFDNKGSVSDLGKFSIHTSRKRLISMQRKLKNKGSDVYIYMGKDLLANVKGAKGDLSKKGKYFV